mmetsp:Transcript_44233/g.130399  ORF Transcript_44233/g.130399 Transcript_44233/m.130399 type:complete len:341 (+) Transcript_44233:503-1525(+)
MPYVVYKHKETGDLKEVELGLTEKQIRLRLNGTKQAGKRKTHPVLGHLMHDLRRRRTQIPPQFEQQLLSMGLDLSDQNIAARIKRWDDVYMPAFRKVYKDTGSANAPRIHPVLGHMMPRIRKGSAQIPPQYEEELLSMGLDLSNQKIATRDKMWEKQYMPLMRDYGVKTKLLDDKTFPKTYKPSMTATDFLVEAGKAGGKGRATCKRKKEMAIEQALRLQRVPIRDGALNFGGMSGLRKMGGTREFFEAWLAGGDAFLQDFMSKHGPRAAGGKSDGGLTKGKNKTVNVTKRTKSCICGAVHASQAQRCKECGRTGDEAFGANKSDGAKRIVRCAVSIQGL